MHARSAHTLLTLLLTATLFLTSAAPGSGAQASPPPTMQTAPTDIFATSPVRLPSGSAALALTKKETSAALVPLDGIVQIAAGHSHTCALTLGGGVLCWGHNGAGQVGDGTSGDRNYRITPTMVSGLSSGVQAIAARGSHTCALTLGSGVLCWGWNGYGQVGDGTTVNRSTPTAVSGLGSGVQAVAAGSQHTCALTVDGGVLCWGGNEYGQVGDGATTDRSTPTAVSGLGSGVQAIAAGRGHTCALTVGGGVLCWGYNEYGQVGDGTTTDRSTPTAVSGLGSGVQAIAAGGVHTCALTVDGGVLCWGYNEYGQVGDGTNADRSTPTAVSGLGSGVQAIAAGGVHTCALTVGGGDLCWGSNEYGTVGDGTTTDRNTPTGVSGLGSGGVQTIAAGHSYTCALTVGGGVLCWGYNHWGQVGDGTTTNRSTPVAVLVEGTGTPTPTLPPLLVVHGIQLFDSGHKCTEAPKRYPGRASTLGNLPGWFIQNYQVWQAYLDSSFMHTPSLDDNAECLKEQVSKLYEISGRQKITIIAHSMGGLVTRACLAFPDCRDKVRAVYTLGSPHAGLNSALVGKILIKLGEAYLKSHGLPIPVGDGICLWQAALCQMSVEEMLWFNGNPANDNQSDIKYTFIGGEASPATYGLGWLISLTDGPHDGIVGRSSAVGWVYPFNQPLPWDWTGGTQLPNLARYWTDEVHANFFDGFAYYQNRGGGESRSYDCIAYREGIEFTSQPSWCQTASPTVLAAESAGPNLSQTTTSIDGVLSTGQTVTHTLSIDTAAASLFTLAWSEGTVAFTLLRPDGQAVTPAYAAAHPDEVTFTSAASSPEFPAFASYAFTSTVAGDWQLQIEATEVISGTGYVGFVALETARSLTVSQHSTIYGVGDTATFTATLQGGGGGIAGATVTAALNRPDGITETLTLADVGGGVYRTNYVVPDAGGRVVMSVLAAGSDGGVPFTRQEERIWTIAPDTAQFTGIAKDRGMDADGNGRFESLAVDVRVNVTQPATYTLSARLIQGGVAIASTAVYSKIAAAGVYTLPLSFDGGDIWAAQLNGPYTVADAVLNNISIGSVPVAGIDTLHTTAAYLAGDFAPDMPPLAVTIAGPTTGYVGSSYLFTATTDSITATLPLTYTWQASGQSQIVQSAGWTSTVTYTWNAIGEQTIEVAASNSAGVVTTTHTITIGEAPTSTPTPTETSTETPTSTPTETPTSTPTATGTPTSTPSPTPTASATPTGTGTTTTTPTGTPTGTPSPTLTPTGTLTPTRAPTATPTVTPTPGGSRYQIFLPALQR